MWRCWSQLQWSWVLHISCSLAVTIQLVSIIQNFISPQSTNSENEEVNIQKMEFPLLFKICVCPSFNNSAAEELGYDGIWNYFSGMSRFNKNIFGWAGHTNSSGVKDTVPGVLSKVQDPETAKTLLTKVRVAWGPGNWTTFNSDPGWQKLAGFRRTQKISSILSSDAYLLIQNKKSFFSRITKIATKKVVFT